MAVCDTHGTGAYGKSCSFYVTLVRDGVRLSRKLRLCGECIRDLQKAFSSQWSDGFVLAKWSESDACASCGEVRGINGTLHPLYATGYSERNQRFDYYSKYCNECAAMVIGHFSLLESANHGG